VLGSIPAAFALSWLALRVRSFLPCFWVHWAVQLTLDALLILGDGAGTYTNRVFRVYELPPLL